MPNVLISNPGVKTGSIVAEFSAVGGGVRKTGSLTYPVIAEAINTSEDSIIATTGIPLIYTEINGMWCAKIRAAQTGPAIHPGSQAETVKWDVTCSFDSHLDVSQADLNPLLRPTVVRWGGETEQDQLLIDAVTGAAVVNAIGELFTNIKRPITVAIGRFTRYEAYPFSPATILSLQNAVNNATFRGAPVGTALMQKVENNPVTISNVQYEQVTYVVKFRIDPDNPNRQDTWKAYQLDVGSQHELTIGGSSFLTEFDFIGGTTAPFPLNTDGTLGDWSTVANLGINRFRKITFPAL